MKLWKEYLSQNISTCYRLVNSYFTSIRVLSAIGPSFQETLLCVVTTWIYDLNTIYFCNNPPHPSRYPQDCRDFLNLLNHDAGEKRRSVTWFGSPLPVLPYPLPPSCSVHSLPCKRAKLGTLQVRPMAGGRWEGVRILQTLGSANLVPMETHKHSMNPMRKDTRLSSILRFFKGSTWGRYYFL